ncbi:MAG TPA: glycosyltransferase family 4 protein [Gaiellales bacterium]|nr:glycosyltransferase family 4 protein [Gaiellales bacterium]
MRTLHVVVPEGIDDPRRPSGGNRYDRRVCVALAHAGWEVVMHEVPWPEGTGEALAAAIRTIPDRSVVLLDGLVASPADAVLVPEAGRLRQVVLVHMALGDEGDAAARRREAAVLSSAAAVVVTSRWSRDELMGLYGLPAGSVHVAEPGVDAAPIAAGTDAGGELLCVATVARAKGHDVLVDALAGLQEMAWSCTCVGSVDRDPPFALQLRAAVERAGLSGRVRLAGACSDAELEQLYRAADLLVHASRAETYGMALTEALAHGLPVVACDVGGIPEALGTTGSGRPGVLVPPGDADALRGALRRWLADARLRARLRAAAAGRRASLPSWPATAAAVARACEAAAR